MSLIYTEGYLKSMEVSSFRKDFNSDIKNILIIPPKNNDTEIIVYIYEYDPYNAIYELHLLNKSIFLKNLFLKEDLQYYIQTNTDKTVYIYYEEEVIN